MATRIEAHPSMVKTALEMALASQKRAKNTSKEPEFQELYDRKIAETQKALGSITEIK